MNLILRPSTPPVALILFDRQLFGFHRSGSEIAIVPVTECRMPYRDFRVCHGQSGRIDGGSSRPAPNDGRGSIEMAGNAAIPISSLRRSGDCRPRLNSSDMSTPFVFEELVRRGLLNLCTAQIRKIAYIAPQNSDVDFWNGSCKRDR